MKAWSDILKPSRFIIIHVWLISYMPYYIIWLYMHSILIPLHWTVERMALPRTIFTLKWEDSLSLLLNGFNLNQGLWGEASSLAFLALYSASFFSICFLNQSKMKLENYFTIICIPNPILYEQVWNDLSVGEQYYAKRRSCKGKQARHI